MQSGRYSAHSLVEKYVNRIHEIDKAGPALNSIIELNPDAESIAANLTENERTKAHAVHFMAFRY
jgi:amidase